MAACAHAGASTGATSTTSEVTTPTTDAVTTTTIDEPGPDDEVITPVVAEVVAEPYAVAGADGFQHVTYELLVTNPASSALTMTAIDALDAADPTAVLHSFSGDELAAALLPIGGVPGPAIAPAGFTRVLLDLSFPTVEDVPAAIEHRISFTLDPAVPGLDLPVVTGRTTISTAEAVELAPPLRGAGWLAAGGCCWLPAYHRLAVLPVNGEFHVPERYAIDFVQIGDNDKVLDGPIEDLSSYPYFGDDILAVADGVVVRTQDGLAEQVPGAFAPGATASSAGGNYVVVDIGDGNFAFFAHLQPGSLTVAVGDHVTTGQVLGKLGNTGNSDGPHLHFHVMDGPLPLASNGRPFTFTSFDSPGTVTNVEDVIGGAVVEIDPALAGGHTDELPLAFQVVDFAD